MEWLDQRLKELKLGLLRLSPFLAFSLENLKIRYVDEDHPGYITVRGDEIRVYRNSQQLDEKSFALVTIKAAIHAIMAHGLRAQRLLRIYGNNEVTRDLARFAAEVVAYRLYPQRLKARVFALDSEFLDQFFGPRKIEWRKSSMEELFKALLDQLPTINLQVVKAKIEGNTGRMIEDLEEGAKISAEGDSEKQTEEGSGKSKSGSGLLGDLDAKIEEAEKRLERVASLAHTFGHWAGKDESDEIRQFVEELLRGKHLPWNTILRRWLYGTLQRHFKTTWKRESRKVPDLLPGHEKFGVRVIVAVDVSGSIPDEEYGKFCREVLGVAKAIGEVIFVTWDAKAKNWGSVRHERDMIRSKNEVTGYGGTKITSLKPVLEELRITTNDVLIVLTDGRFYEAENEVQQFLREIKAKKVLVTTDVTHEGFDKVIKMEVRNA